MALNPKNTNLMNVLLHLVKYKYKEHQVMLSKEEKKVNSFKIEAIVKNLKYIGKTKKEIKSSEDLKNVKGFGPGTLSRIDEILKTGKLKEINTIKNRYKNIVKFRKIVDEIIDVIGIGETTAINIVKKHNIVSFDDFKMRVENNLIEVNDKIKLGLKYIGKYEKKIKRNIITQIYENIKKTLDKDLIIEVCGSYRRGLSYSSDIDILICDKNLKTMDQVKESEKLKSIVKKLKKDGLVTDDLTDKNIKTKYMGFIRFNNKNYRIDIRLVSDDSFYTALVYFTGSHYFNVSMRNKAKKLFYRLNEYNLLDVTGRPVAISSEKELFDKLKMKYLEPYERD